MKLIICAAIIFSSLCVTAQTLLPYQDARLSTAERVNDLLHRMTAEEKFWQLFMCPGDVSVVNDTATLHGIFGLQVSASSGGDAAGQILKYNTIDDARSLMQKINEIQRYYVEKTRLGIPAIMFDEALHGLVRAGSTSFPQAIALAATFDTALVGKVASAIADETKARGIRQILSPVINIAGDVRWGRVEETYGEDPLLSSDMGVAFVGAFERDNIITTPKHLIANVGDGGRDSYPIYYNERLLEETYFPPFRACFEKGHARSVMTAYNSLNGISCSTNSWLLLKKLKGDWSFDGFVISDANAVGGDIVLHHTAKDYAQAGANAINNGLDVIFQSDIKHYRFFKPAFLDGRIDSSRMNDAVSRVLKAKFDLGLFDKPYVTDTELTSLLNDSLHQALAKTASIESIVLLKNEDGILPLSPSAKTIAIIGEEADTLRLGGYSGPGNTSITLLKGIQDKVPANVSVLYNKGVGVFDKEYTTVPSSYLTSKDGHSGLTGVYFNNITLDGVPTVSKVDKQINFQWTLSLPDKSIQTDFYSARWDGKISAPQTGRFKIGLEGNDGFRLYLQGKLVVDRWIKQTYSVALTDFYFEKGRQYDISIEFFEPVGNAHLKLIWTAENKAGWQQQIRAAVETASHADVVIVTAGIHEGEFQDRASLALPNHQEEMIKAIARTGKPVVVVLTGGSAITMTNWLSEVKGVLDVWYSGEQGGRAVADVLFGDDDPSGRLPITFPISEAQLPLSYRHAATGRGDDYYNLSGLPLFPFGFGLSYTTFDYSNIRLERDVIRQKDSTTVRCVVKNSGRRSGAEIVQLYLHKRLSTVSVPVIQLSAYQRVNLEPGESKEIAFRISPEMLSILDSQLKRVVEPGEFDIMIGSSSRDIRLRSSLSITE